MASLWIACFAWKASDLLTCLGSDLEFSENHFFLSGESVPFSVVAVDTVECVEALSADMVFEELLEEVKLDMVVGVMCVVV